MRCLWCCHSPNHIDGYCSESCLIADGILSGYYKKNHPKAAPPQEALYYFGGPLSIDQFRRNVQVKLYYPPYLHKVPKEEVCIPELQLPTKLKSLEFLENNIHERSNITRKRSRR